MIFHQPSPLPVQKMSQLWPRVPAQQDLEWPSSILSPSADENRSITPAREKAMKIIIDIKNGLSKELPDGIARYNDFYNPNCVGDSFTSSEIPTILFEAGHYPDDYDRTIVTNYIFKAFKLLLKSFNFKLLFIELRAKPKPNPNPKFLL